ncbi:MAG: hypothetical protein PHR81_06935 [Bacteroidales bacterium]|jgi:hypothetical protein|nr:hypothetical protein [Bacteroidales bacterium]MDD4214530.1 hypothetical protein [Bacteroidales bacterium]
MKSFFYILFFITLFVFQACKPSPYKAENYYHDILTSLESVIENEDSLVVAINTIMIHDSVTSSAIAVTEDTTVLNELHKKLDIAFNNLRLQISVSFNKISSMPPFDKEDNLRVAAIKLVETYKNICDKEYAEVITIVKTPAVNYTYEDDNKFLEITEMIDNNLQDRIDNFAGEAKIFAKNYKFNLENE